MPLFAGSLGHVSRTVDGHSTVARQSIARIVVTLARIASAVLVITLVVLTFLAVVLFGPVSS